MNKIIWAWTNKEGTLEQVQNQVGEGWHKIIEDLVNALFLAGWSGRLTQVKEKFGGLRFYAEDIKFESDMDKLIDAAEELSFKTCEYCGKPGKPRKGGWIKTLCDDCVSSA